MATIRPTTRSHGFLVLPYTSDGALHRCASRITFSDSNWNPTSLASVANQLAPLIAACMPPSQSLSTYEVYDNTNSFLYGGNLSASYPGTHSTTATQQAYKSTTIALTGKGIAGQPGYAVGQTRLTFRVKNAHVILPGSKRIVFDASLRALANYLAASAIIWHDFYGQKAIMRDGVTVQMNGHIQRKEGT